MADLIDRDATLRQILECYEYEYPTASGAFDEFATRIVPSIFKNAPTVSAVEVVHGQWIGYDTSSYGGLDSEGDVKWLPRKFYRCSECHKGTAVTTKWCPNCGAKMGGKDGDNNDE